ncbi:MAG TPA: stalk domain-containing protein [Syntrophomonadaceae bacterium]|nr:stalk domain-containing protein [Syntrophomonadaceae bacterium]
MRRIVAGMISIALLILSMPGMGLAEDAPKKVFISNYLNYFSKSVEMQKSFQEALQKNTIKLGIDENIKECNVDLADGTHMSNVPGKASCVLAFNLADMKGSCDFKAQLSKYNVQGQVFVDKNGLILPRETVQSLAGTGADFSELGDLKQLPSYVIYPFNMGEQELTALNQAFSQSPALQQKQLEDIQVLLEEVLNIIPDHCYSYSGSYAVLDLTQIAKDPQELLDNLKSHSESLTDKLLALTMDNPSFKDNPDLQQSMTQARTTMIAGINSLTLSDLVNFLKEIPISVTKFQISTLADSMQMALDMTGSFGGDTLHFAMTSDDQMKADAITSSGTVDLSVHSPDFNLDFDMTGNGNTHANSATFKAAISGKANSKQDKISGKVDLNFNMDWSKFNQIIMPDVNPGNSKRVLPKNMPLQISLDGKQIAFRGPGPLTSNGRTMVPLRDIAAALGCKIDWQEPDTIVLSHDNKDNLVLHIDSNTYTIGDQEYSTDSPPTLKFDRTYVPIGIIAQYLNLAVSWDETIQTVYLHQM